MANDKKAVQEKEKRKSMTTPPPGGLDELERWFGGFVPRGWMRPFQWDVPAWSEMMSGPEEKVPRVDVVDQEDTLLVRAELPGVSKDDIDVSLSNNLLTISARTSKETTREGKDKYQRREIYRGSFSRSLTLPVEVDGENAKAQFKDGILELRFPKSAQAKRRSISIEE